MSGGSRPEVTLKLAVSLDGRIATRTGDSQWITGPEARSEARRLRGASDAILVGVGTVTADDPRLTTRVGGLSDPVRVVADSRLRTPPHARVVREAPNPPTWLLTTEDAPDAARTRLERSGVEILTVGKTCRGRVDLERALAALGGRGVRRLLVEGGGEIAGALVDAGLVDRLVVFVAPMVIGGTDGRSAVGGRGSDRLADALRLIRFDAVRRVGDDVLLAGAVDRT